MSLFYNVENDEEINPLDIVGKKCFCTSTIKIESIFIGSGAGGDKIFLQVKLYECGVEFLDTGMKRLLNIKTVNKKVNNNNPLLDDDFENDDFENDDFKDNEKNENDNSIKEEEKQKIQVIMNLIMITMIITKKQKK